MPPGAPDHRDVTIAEAILERFPPRATLQVGIGGIPNALMSALHNRRDLGVHTELLSDGIMDLVERGVVTGTHKTIRPHKVVTTFVLGTQRLHDLLHDNGAVEMLPVDYVNDPRTIAPAALRLDQRDDRGRPRTGFPRTTGTRSCQTRRSVSSSRGSEPSTPRIRRRSRAAAARYVPRDVPNAR